MTAADILITNAHVLTMDPARPRAEAVAIAGNRIIRVGSHDDVAGLKAKHTRVIDAAQKTVMPGIIEGHVHLFGGAVELETLILNGMTGFATVADAVARFRRQRPGEPVLLATGIAHEAFGEPITRQMLDRMVPDIPFIMGCFDHHTMWANTRALEAAGIMNGRDLPVGNEIVLDHNGIATGELREPAAYMPVQALTPTGGREWLGMTTGENPNPPATAAQRELDIGFFKKGIAHAASLGITSMHNMDGNWYQLELLQALLDRGEMLARVEIPFHQKNTFEIARVEEAADMRAKYGRTRPGGEMLHCDRVKVFIDGVLETYTALMLEGYPDQPENMGAPLFTAEEMNEIVRRADRHGLQVATHAIGDGGVRRTLDAYENAIRTNGKRSSRHRIEHIEMIDPADIPRLKELGVIASLQPIAGVGVPGSPHEPILSRVGSKLPWSYAWQTLRDSGAVIAFSSDWPVAPLSPFLGMQAAMTAAPLSPDCPPQAQTLMDTLHSFTAAGAYMEFMEDRKGTLKENYLADVVVLDSDMEKTPKDQVANVRPVTTICDGRVSFEA
ncbi:amidohydrolase [Aestuariivirga sp.]|uniref:amidohydrolase n=1 Tax=Aestuariivirga sp. TaxID=2650926 RepID=UPI0025BD6F82|nr:amidohydrolase [Aestuariivirga sp.]MCA3554040.1 amidohydrolase [Aestuariivirga sp.]